MTISNWGFHPEVGDVTAQAIDSMGGVSLVLPDATAWLKYGIELNLVADRTPPDVEA